MKNKNIGKSTMFMIASSLACITSDMITKNAIMPLSQLLFFRFFISFLLLAICFPQRIKIITLCSKNNCIRGGLFTISMNIFSYTLQELTLGTVILLNFSTPILTTIFSKIILKEKLQNHLIACLINTFGITLTMYTSLNISNMPAIICSVIASTLFAFIDIFNKYQNNLNTKEEIIDILIGSNFISTILSILLLCLQNEKLQLQQVHLVLSTGITAILIPYFLLKATFYTKNLAALQPLKYIEFPISTLCGYVFFNEQTHSNIWISFCIILLGTIFSYLQTKAD